MTDGQDPREIVRLTTAANPVEAHLWEQVLADADIYCQVVGEYLDAGIGDITGLQPELWVYRKDLGPARAALERSYQPPVESIQEKPAP